MGKYEKLLEQILLVASDATISIDDPFHLLKWLGFKERVRGSHHMFIKEGVKELVNLQRDGNKAKIYQVRQVRAVLLKYRLRGDIHGQI